MFAPATIVQEALEGRAINARMHSDSRVAGEYYAEESVLTVKNPST
jgi:hypothetical protein